MRWRWLMVTGVLGCSASNGAYDPPSQDDADESSGAGDPTGSDDVDDAEGGASDDATGSASATTSGDGGDQSTTGDEDGPALEGTWWGCELGLAGNEPADGCALLDDEGLRFLPDGTIEHVWWATAPSKGCLSGGANPGACFPFDHPDPGPFESAPWGTWMVDPADESLDPYTMKIVFEREQCKTTLSWSEPVGLPYARVGSPEIEFACGAIAVEEPNGASLGPWYLRRLDTMDM